MVDMDADESGFQEYTKPSYSADTLPAEIICHIASYLVEDARTRDDQPAPGRWLPILRVCKRWHDVIMNQTTAWTGVAIGRVESIRMFLDRSGNQPLTVAGSLATGDVESDFTKLCMIMANSWRLQSLRLFEVSSDVWAKFEALVDHAPTSKLEELEVCKHGMERSEALTRFASTKLRRLWLEGFHFDDMQTLLIPSLAHLTSLTLVDISWHPTVSEVLGLLRHTTVLESLMLGLDMAWSTPTNETVRLEALSSLGLCTFYIEEADLLHALDLPALEYFGLKINPCRDELDERLNIAQSIIVQMDKRTPMKGSTLYSSGIGSLCCMLTPDARGTTPDTQLRGVRLLFEDFGAKEEYEIMHILRRYVVPKTPAVEHLTVYNGRAETIDEILSWGVLLMTMQTVKSLEISGRYSTCFAFGLCLPGDTRGVWHPLFPALQEVRLRHLWFRPTPDVDLEPGHRAFINRLLKPYQSCENSQQRIRLTIRNCVNISEGDVTQIEDTFTRASVVWDGVAVWRDRDDDDNANDPEEEAFVDDEGAGYLADTEEDDWDDVS
ncbi:hypothetical protein NEOLEDRAFT_1183595 [Neolentinus lepideus HHB14362 ss-1]|uniref:F-box domain-containing protein n=1 Tax=Neolentinus lepideus HHB14362 ss-1 TaxID=1314782 RepID=A0A165N614_9AGAM|nr:hypothetical protein NEOLEDRAFT_1183595 [Neolentinus lepideus HHB14362 ss-1]